MITFVDILLPSFSVAPVVVGREESKKKRFPRKRLISVLESILILVIFFSPLGIFVDLMRTWSRGFGAGHSKSLHAALPNDG